jgi:hypothetical protein
VALADPRLQQRLRNRQRRRALGKRSVNDFGCYSGAGLDSQDPAVTADDLSAPLGQTKPPRRHRAAALMAPWLALAALSAFALVLAGWAMLADDPLGGEPVATVRLEAAFAGPPPGAGAVRGAASSGVDRPSRLDESSAAATPAPSPAPVGRTITIIDGSSGRREQVVLPEPADTPPAGAEPGLPTTRAKPTSLRTR